MSRPALGVFVILWASYAFFWHARDWNTASRLMLTYAIVDRGTIRIDGLDDQTGDKALYRNHYYSDKLPGYSFAATIPYLVAKHALGLPSHPIDVPGFAHWPGDYLTTLFTSGLLTAITGAMLVGLARDVGCGPRRSILVGLAYGLATPAYAYATLAYGHQASAACLLGAFALLWRDPGRRVVWSSGVAGFLAAYASVIEIQVGPVSAILGCYAIALALGRRRPASSVLAFAVAALIPTLFLLAYDWIAFDSPFRMGYFYHATQRFAQVHSASNPLGLRRPDWGRLDDLMILPARGLLWYTPITVLAIPGLIALAVRRQIGVAIVSMATVSAVLLVNLSYPEWSGGWSTGPRLLVPMLPFVMLLVAGLLAVGGRFATGIAATLAITGGIVILLFQGVGARVPDPQPTPPGIVQPLDRPLTDAVWPIWRGDRPPGWLFGHRFVRNLVSIRWPDQVSELPAGRQWLQFLPLVVVQAIAIGLVLGCSGSIPVRLPSSPAIESPPVDRPEPARPDPA